MNNNWRWIPFLTEHPGSTRSAGLLRLFWGLILWARWADELLPFRRMEFDHWVLSAAFFSSTLCMVIGFFSRTTTLASGLIALYMVFVAGHLGGNEPWTHHHTTYLAVGTLILGLTPCGKSFSVDRWIALRRAESAGLDWPVEYGNVWALRLLALQLSAVYFWGAIDKTRWAVLEGDRIEQPLMYLYLGSDYPGAWFQALSVGIACLTVLLEYSLAFGLWFRRFQGRLMPLGILFHCTIYYVFPVTVFSVVSILTYLAFMPPEAVHRGVNRMLGVKP